MLTGSTGTTDWPGYGRLYDQQRFSALTQINTDTVATLGLATSLDLPDVPAISTAPLEHAGILYFAAGYSVVYAVEAVSGRLLWKYDPKVRGPKMRMAWGSRGLALWGDKVYVGTQDGRLLALHAATGKLAWQVQTAQRGDARYITGAPLVFKDTVLIGQGGTDFGATRGYVTAYQAQTGRKLWRFYLVPGDPAKGFENDAMRMAAKTWTGQWWRFGGGGTVWNAMTYDPEFNRIYLGTGNGAPWNRKIRSPGGGDNLFLSCIVALRGRHRALRVALPDHARGHLGLRCRGGHGAGDAQHPRHAPQGAAAGAQERVLLRPRPQRRAADLRAELRQGHVGHRHRRCERAPSGSRACTLREWRGAAVARAPWARTAGSRCLSTRTPGSSTSRAAISPATTTTRAWTLPPGSSAATARWA